METLVIGYICGSHNYGVCYRSHLTTSHVPSAPGPSAMAPSSVQPHVGASVPPTLPSANIHNDSTLLHDDLPDISTTSSGIATLVSTWQINY